MNKLTAASVLIAVLLLTAAILAQTGPDDIIDSYSWNEVYVVNQGDTLWEIAEEINSDLDPRLIVAAIKKVNEIDTMIRVNQKIVIPEK
ncbi:LysM domain-containing protein [Halanaerobium saccharolyticum]|uniref:LysM domain-containing protein n=1 Tax=Halanaerobium saccharolyticum TaxID=43595 RepID=A0A4R6S5Q4_9FIRM|nr:LysM peptidoglycan-binding domain-containing protein [Halanaerobium saccharolyticum]TDP94673.1 LysM domain-containing protein [Halanaerobium saccharolyticum]